MLQSKYGISGVVITPQKAEAARLGRALREGPLDEKKKVTEILEKRFAKLHIITPTTTFVAFSLAPAVVLGAAPAPEPAAVAMPDLIFHWK